MNSSLLLSRPFVEEIQFSNIFYHVNRLSSGRRDLSHFPLDLLSRSWAGRGGQGEGATRPWSRLPPGPEARGGVSPSFPGSFSAFSCMSVHQIFSEIFFFIFSVPVTLQETEFSFLECTTFSYDTTFSHSSTSILSHLFGFHEIAYPRLTIHETSEFLQDVRYFSCNIEI